VEAADATGAAEGPASAVKTCPDCAAFLNFDDTCGVCGWQPTRRRAASASSGHVEELRTRAAGTTRETKCTEPGCTQTVGQHMDEFRRLTSRLPKRP
jgi:hypothetical protein